MVLVCEKNSPRARRRVAKIVERKNAHGEHRLKREPRFLRLFHGDERVVQCHRCVDKEEEGRLYMILEYCEKGDLLEYVNNHPNMSISGIKNTMQRMASIVYLLHQHHIAHRDIKLENFLVRKDDSICISDFGLSTVVTNAKHNAPVGTIAYAAPEMLEIQDKKIDVFKCDVYSLGICFYVIYFRKFPFSKERELMTLEKKQLFFQPEFSQSVFHFQMLLCHMLNPNPDNRYSIEDVLNDQYLLKK